MRIATRASARLEESFALRRLARRVRSSPSTRSRPEPLERPVGAKLEITYACNLRCDFCYTDSPRRTLQRSIDMDDDAWRRTVQDCVDLGILEAVVTGGEPLLRAPLVLELLETLDSAGLAVSMNTNGWFVDEGIGDRLAALDHLTVHISIDGATPEVHDTGRGVPGSWRRAMRAIDLLMARGATVTVNSVVTPLTEDGVADLLDVVWRTGVGLMRITPVLPVGAASRETGWTVDRRRLRAAVDAFTEGHGEAFQALVQAATGDQVAFQDERSPGALLVRPDGAVRIDSITPFSFGHVDDGLETCWQRIAEGWRSPRVMEWADSIGSSRGLGTAPVVAYADDDPPAYAPLPDRRGTPPAVSLPKRFAPSTERPADPGDIAAARDHVTSLALARRYRATRIRWAGNRPGDRIVRVVASGHVCRLSASAGLILDTIDGATGADAAAALRERFPDADPARVDVDTLALLRFLLDRGVIEPAPAA